MADESVIMFTSRRENSIGAEKQEPGNYFEDIYISNKVDGQWLDAVKHRSSN